MTIQKNFKKNANIFNRQINIPKHIAIIMDGNGRWAKKRNKPRAFGHKTAVNTIKKIVEAANNFNIKILTLFAFSTENWKRSFKEVDFLMKLPIAFFNSFVPELEKKNVKVTTIGKISELPKRTLNAINRAKEKTSKNTGMILNFAVNYGGRDEIVNATKSLIGEVIHHRLTIENLDAKVFRKFLFTGKFGNLDYPDLVIRTSGEYRISNFLLWQSAYSEFYFTKKYWPDFTSNDLLNAIKEYSKRDRRFGKV